MSDSLGTSSTPADQVAEKIAQPQRGEPLPAPLFGELAGGERRQEADRIALVAVAGILGHASPSDVDVGLSLLELGFDSVSAVKLRKLLADETGVVLEASVFDVATTVGSLADELVASRGGQPGDDSPEIDELLSALRGANDDTAASELVQAVEPAISALPEALVFTPGTTLRRSGSETVLVCLPSLMPGSGPHQFARIAQALTHDCDVVGLSLPGFDGRLPPGALEDLAAAAMEAVVEEAGGREVVLVGYSSGGLVALATAAKLDRVGRTASGVILIDTYDHKHPSASGVYGASARQVVSLDDAFVSVRGEDFATTNRYLHLFDRWEPSAVGCPMLQLRASQSLAGGQRLEAGGDQRSVPTDHFGTLSSPSVPSAIDLWLEMHLQ